ncbi:hypothetical protein [Marinobacterium stanieri]|uniref:Uncharacterized protein n=1 Tax=Marinobacterium stanieri TaxID=49186 RepID=A0A1N6X8S4_9GAMM|nr:hypothetical protein [Marinobacterium stanieri]SIQ98754.1 hypothetical protein SAMN05421647_11320 [Marinobacterium stanieri]
MREIEQNFSGDPGLQAVFASIRGYESWVESDPSKLESMDDSIRAVLRFLDSHGAGLPERSSDQMNDLVEALLVVIAATPVDQAFSYLNDFQKYEPFFQWLIETLHQNPPLKGFAKTLLGRAYVIQQRELQLAFHSDENFQSLSLILESIIHDG